MQKKTTNVARRDLIPSRVKMREQKAAPDANRILRHLSSWEKKASQMQIAIPITEPMMHKKNWQKQSLELRVRRFIGSESFLVTD